MKNEIRGFLFLALGVICFCTHQICNKIFEAAAIIGSVNTSPEGGWVYGGIALFLFSMVFMILAILFFIRAFQER